MKKTATLIAVCISLCAVQHAAAQTCAPFANPTQAAYYAVLGPQEQATAHGYTPPQPSKLYSMAATTGALTQIGIGDLGLHFSNVSYQTTSNYLYGLVDSSSYTAVPTPQFRSRNLMYRVGKNACVQRIGVIVPPAASNAIIFSNIGDMDAQGNYYFLSVVLKQTALPLKVDDYDFYIGCIAAEKLATPKSSVAPTYVKINMGNSNLLFNDYLNAYCTAMASGKELPSGGVHSWTYNRTDGNLWSYLPALRSFFQISLPDMAHPELPVTAMLSPAPVGFPTLLDTDFDGFYFDTNKNLFAIDAENAAYWQFTNCENESCSNLTQLRSYTQAFGASNPTFFNLRGGITSNGVLNVPNPTDQPFANCNTSQFFIASTAAEINGSGNFVPAGISRLFSVAPGSGSLTPVSVDDQMKKHFDGLAFNATNNFLYATTDSLRFVGGSFLQDAALHRIDNAGFTKEWGKMPAPITTGTARAFILPQAADMDENGNYYFSAVVLNNVRGGAPYTANGYTLYMGEIAAAAIGNSTPSVTPFSPTYRKISTSGCSTIFDSYIEAFVAAVIEEQPRPTNGLQAWSYNPTDKKLWSFLSQDNVYFFIDLTSKTATNVSATCAPIGAALVPSVPNPNFSASFWLDSNLYLWDSQNGVYYQLTNCSGNACASLDAVTSYGGSFSPAHPSFDGLVADGASCARPSPLPVELLSFAARPENCINTLQWVTATEKNNQYFEVQRSTDALHFATIGTVRGNGTTNTLHTYSFDDKTATRTTYYRLAQIDADGTVNYPSSVIAAYSACDNTGVAAVFPNPTTHTATVVYTATAAEAGSAMWYLTDAVGRIVATENIEIGATVNYITVGMSQLPDGVYTFGMRGNGWYATPQRLVKVQKK